MYSRKQFFFAAAEKCIDWIKSCNSFLSYQKNEQAEESDNLIPESLFLEAISLGIDPGTMNAEQLNHAVNSSTANNLNHKAAIK